MRQTTILGLLALCLGCSNAGSTLVKDTLDAGPQDTAAEFEVTLPDLTMDITPDLLPDLTLPDSAPTDALDAFVECEPGSGCAYEECADAAECQSGFCLPHLGDKVCSPMCVEECAPGFSCIMPDWVGPDLVFLCLSNFPTLCQPCAVSSDCQGYAGDSASCVVLPGHGSFCSSPCDDEEQCPEGFVCSTGASIEGSQETFCRPDSGECACSKTSIAVGASTPCQQENQWGICPGFRVCTETGLSDCDAPLPTQDLCNGLDDDCDGETDEDTCDDGNACTKDDCLGVDGCLNEPLTGTECIDGDPCTVADHCDAGQCLGSPLGCDDANPCTDDSCQGAAGCVHEPNFLPCDDGEPCTVQDQCNNGACTGYPLDCHCQLDSDCALLEDGDLCNGILECDTSALPFVCAVKPGTVVACEAPQGLHAFCNAASCDPETGECSIVPAKDGMACDDGNACTIGETCAEGLCSAGVALNCNDGNPCTNDACDPDDGCYHVNNELPCDDGTPCTTLDTCQAGACVGGPWLVCNDENPCTDDACTPASGCTFVPNSAPCDDGNACTANDQCGSGSCLAGALLDCDDNNLCTDDLCAPDSGCVHTFNSAPCSDGNGCTNGDQCVTGQCQPGPVIGCDDGNPCTDDSCANGACLHAPNSADCDDGNACSVGDSCQGGQCVPAASLYCNDDNVCTDDSCDLKLGCIHVANTAPCSDANLCTVNDTCADGTCQSGAPLTCKDDNPCTDDSCAPDAGCLYTVNQAPCDDGNACTPDDACDNGVCTGTGDPGCDDGLFCNGKESCQPETGCLDGTPPDLDDEIPCTVDDCHEDSDTVTHTPDDTLCPGVSTCQPDLAPGETCVYPLGHESNPALSCLAILEADDNSEDGLYWLDPEGDGSPFKALCDMSTDGGGWTRVVVIRSNSIAHGDNSGAVGDVAEDNAPGKLPDATINLLNTVGYWRFNCDSQSRFVKNVNNSWTSKKVNSENWSMDRNKDLTFECAANHSGYVLSDFPACASGHLNYVAKDGLPEGGGCYYANSGWHRNGSLWAR